MKITFLVDQAAALRAGRNAPSSTVVLDVDPTSLLQIERDVIAAVLRDGHDATKTGLDLGSLEIVSSTTGPKIQLIEPDMPGLTAAIAALLVERAQTLAARAEDTQRADAVLRAAKVETRKAFAVLRHGYPRGPAEAWALRSSHSDGISVEIEIPVLQNVYQPAASSEARAEYKAREQATEQRACEIVDAALPALLDMEATAKAAEAKARAKEKAEYDVLFSRLPAELQERCNAGFADADKAIAALLIEDLGELGLHDAEPNGWRSADREATELTAEQFARLKAVKAALPEGATVDVLKVHDYRPATNADAPEAVDNDGEVICNRRKVARVTYTRGGIEACIAVRL